MDKMTKTEHNPKSPQAHSAISAIAMLAIKTAMHSRIVIWLLAAVVGITTLLPLLLKGDGSPVGHMRIVITYPLAISFIVLALGTLWLSSGLISLEISGKEIQSIVTKPVRAFDIWLGKWLAMVAINIALIAVTTLGLLISINLTLNHYNHQTTTESPSPQQNGAEVPSLQQNGAGVPSPRTASISEHESHPPKKNRTEEIYQQVLSARHAVQIEPIANIEWKAEKMRQRLIQQNVIPDTTTIAKMCGELKAARSMVAPNKTISWTINLPPQYDQSPEIRDQRSEVRGQRSEVRGQRSEVRGQMSDVRGQRSEVRC